MLGQKRQNALSLEQKVGFTLLLIFALLAVSLGFLQIRNTLYKSFAMHKVVPFDIKDQVDTMEALRFRDTDQDGLTDFDELYLYNTSRYLEDTDSDGILDGQEVLKGTNPLCGEGKDCGIDLLGDSQGGAGIINVNMPKPTLNIAGIETDGELIDLRLIFDDPEKIRLLLIEGGIGEDEIGQLSDEELLEATKSYREMAEQGANAEEQLEALYSGVKAESEDETGKEKVSGVVVEPSDDIASIRNTLLQSGIPADVLDQISDDQILEYLKENQ